jgi:hypothetical protein
MRNVSNVSNNQYGRLMTEGPAGGDPMLMKSRYGSYFD